METSHVIRKPIYVICEQQRDTENQQNSTFVHIFLFE